MKVITRFAPSPTGYLHIGSARTAIFNYLFAKHYNGKFLLRIEDTDKERSTEEATKAIINGLAWLGIEHDEEIIFQSKREARHKEIAYELLKMGKAYKCYMTQEEIDEQRQKAISESKSFLLRSPWREKENSTEEGKKFVIRIKAPREGLTEINDIVQGHVSVQNEILDDFVLLRGDGTPTYMLAVVVDDHDMSVTHIIRGDDHLNNGFRQKIIYQAMGWEVPIMGHIPLIHGEDGAKLSKRHGAVGVESYKDMGYMADALFNYLLRLGWSHGNDEVITKSESISWFDGSHIGKAASRMDFAKMKFINAQYIKNEKDEKILEYILHEWDNMNIKYEEDTISNIKAAISEIKVRCELVYELADLAKIYHSENIFEFDEEAKIVADNFDKKILEELIDIINSIEDFTKDFIQEKLKAFATSKNMKIGELMKPIRAILTGKLNSPSVFEIISIIGKETTIKRIRKFL